MLQFVLYFIEKVFIYKLFVVLYTGELREWGIRGKIPRAWDFQRGGGGGGGGGVASETEAG
jgi:hypothetical protein